MFRRKKKGMSNKSILRCIYLISTMPENDDSEGWQKESLREMLEKTLPNDKHTLRVLIAESYEGVNTARDKNEERIWRLILDALEEINEKR